MLRNVFLKSSRFVRMYPHVCSGGTVTGHGTRGLREEGKGGRKSEVEGRGKNGGGGKVRLWEGEISKKIEVEGEISKKIEVEGRKRCRILRLRKKYRKN